jgi:hypothetical protein
MKKLLAILLFCFSLAPALAQAPPPVGALPDAERRTSYSITSSVCTCSVGFSLFGSNADVDSWIEVWVNGVRYVSTDPTFGWSVSSATGPLATIPRPITNAVLTFNSPQTATVQIVGAERPRRLSQFAENRGVAARDLNLALTDLVAQNRETWDKTNDVTGRGLFGQPGTTYGQLPAPSSCMGKFVAFDSSGSQPICTASLPGTGAGVISGPATSTVGDLATWGNTTGTSLQDSGAATARQDIYFRSGRPWADVRAYGAVCNGSTDDTAAFSSAISAVEAIGSGGVFVPPTGSACCLKSGVTTASGTQIFGISVDGVHGGSSVSACGADVTVITLNGTHGALKNLLIFGKGQQADTFGAVQPAVVLGSNCTSCRVDHVSVTGGGVGLKVSAVDAYVEDVEISSTYGTALLQITGSIPTASWLIRNKLDSSGSCSLPPVGTTISPWAGTTGYTTGAVVSTQGYYIQATANGTSGGSQPTLRNYFVTITDGTVTWKLCAPTTYYALNLDSGASEVHAIANDYSGFFTQSVAMTNSLGGTAPNYLFLHSGVVSSLSGGIYLAAGTKAVITGVEIAGCITPTCFGVGIAAAFGGIAIVTGNTFESNNVAINLGGGGDTIINGNYFTCNGSSQAGVQIAAGISNFIVANNNLRNCTTGVLVVTGSSDYYNIVNNILHGATLTDNGSGTHKTLSGNN